MKRDPVQPGQESVWDYPRPPRRESTARHVAIAFDGETIVDTTRALRVLETSHPPVYYVPENEVVHVLAPSSLQRSPDRCPFVRSRSAPGSTMYHHVGKPREGRRETELVREGPEVCLVPARLLRRGTKDLLHLLHDVTGPVAARRELLSVY